MEQPQRSRSHTVTTTASSFTENFSTSSSSFAYDKEFLRTLPGILIVAEIVFGLLVWTLIAGTEYFRVPAFGWVMFVAVFYWVLTVFFLIIYMTMTYTRIPQVPWTTVVRKHIPYYAPTLFPFPQFFAFVVTICYAGNTYFSFLSWRSQTVQ
ncbi:CKLF-like MARVEL transmembrane domain-containing protein 8 [Petaurus breviceps papuanus]|uniref:CKLF-like MARVEL transmembrane domain-containing protein 8 n=1 Tax=Petaurus breviceps papuanus TaxID=3040969 RepID=UPI0036D8F825